MPSQMYCPVCAAAISAEAAFCSNCGSRFTEEQPLPGHAADEPPAPPAVIGIDYAGFWMRLLAFIVDAIPLTIMAVLVDFLSEDRATGVLLRVLIGVSYTVGFWVAANGATPGKMAMGIRVVRSNGEPIDAGWAIVRYLGYYLSTILLLAGFAMIALTPQKRGLHDYIARTVVVRVR